MRSSQDPCYVVGGEEAEESEEEGEFGSSGGEEDNEESSPRASVGSSAAWPQSYKHSMDIYSTLQSPNISLFSPGIHRISSSYLSSSYQRLPGRSAQTQPTSASEPLRIPFLPEKLERGEHRPYVSDLEKKSAELVKKAEDAYQSETKVAARQGSSFIQGLFNGINVLAGVGLLTTPYALKEGGWMGLLLLFVLSFICFYTGLLLRRCLESGPGLATYPDIGEAAFGNTGRLIISIILYVELYACCVEFLILEGDNLSALFPWVHLNSAGIKMSSNTLFSFLTAMCVLPTVWLRDISLLSYVSVFVRHLVRKYLYNLLVLLAALMIAGGVIASIVVGVTVFWVGAVDGVGFHQSGPLFSWSGIPVSIGLYGFCYSGHAVFPNIYSSLKNRNDFNKLLFVSFALCTLLYGGMAVMGFTMFGQATASQITLNLPKQFLASKIAVWTTVVNPFTKYALSMTPVALSLEELLPQRPDSLEYRSASILIRTSLVVSTLAVAISVPFFGFVMAFIGSFLSMTVSVILPCACYLVIFGKKVHPLQAVICYLFMSIGVLCLIGGTYSSVSGIVYSYYHAG